MKIDAWLQQSITHVLTAIWGYIRQLFMLDKQDMLYGLRMTIIAVAPLIVTPFIHQPVLGVMAFLGALYTGGADTGGLYSRRAMVMIFAMCGIAISGLVATAVSFNPLLSTVCMFVFALVGGMLSVFGNFGTRVGFAFTASFIVILGEPGGISYILPRCAAILLGGTWAILVTLWAWPLRPYQPIRDAVAAYYTALGSFIRDVSVHADVEGQQDELRWEEEVLQARVQGKNAHDTAHDVVMSARNVRGGSSEISQQLFLLTLKADRLFSSMVALIESIETAPQHIRPAQTRATLAHIILQIADQLVLVADAIAHDQRKVDTKLLEEIMQAIAGQEAALQKMQFQTEIDYTLFSNLRHILRTLNYLCNTLQSVVDVIEEPENKQLAGEYAAAVPDERSNVRDIFQQLKDNLNPESLIFRHALRLGVTTAFIVAFCAYLAIPHGYWMTLTALIILKPDFQSTQKRAIQRVSGTVAGGLLAAGLAAVLHNILILYLFIIIMGFFAYAHQWRHYSIFVLFLTPFIVLMIDLAEIGNWEIALLRMGNTIAGGILALIAIYLFWPQWESERLPEQLATTVEKVRLFFHSVLSVYLGGAYNHEAISCASKEAHIECLNAAAAFQRLLSEPKAKRGNTEQLYALVMYCQHITDGLTVLATQLPVAYGPYVPPGLACFTKQAEETLKRVEDALRTGKHPYRMPLLQESLRELRDALNSVVNIRVTELAANKVETTNRDILRIYAPVSRQLDKMAQDMEGMYQIVSA